MLCPLINGTCQGRDCMFYWFQRNKKDGSCSISDGFKGLYLRGID